MENYGQIIANEESLTLNRIIEISEQSLPFVKRKEPWKYVNHGVNLLTTDDELNAYMLAYGEMHSIKCRAAFQNFPFDNIYTNFEIVDWGCGQGLATMVLLEMLSERGLERFVKKITLIEPSSAALSRAQINICQIVNGSAEVVTLNKYLPGDSISSDNEIVKFDSTYSYTIHILSNILDIPTINLEKLSRIISSNRGKAYVVCIGPYNRNSWRIDAFEGYFHLDSDGLFTNIEDTNYAYTQKTYHQITCKTKGFLIDNSVLRWDGTNRYQELERRTPNEDYLDDYTSASILFRNIFPQSLLTAYERINNQLNPTDILFIRPNINGDTPDLVLFRPQVGIVLFDISDEDFPGIDTKENINNHTHNNSSSTENAKIIKQDLFSIVDAYANRLIDLHMASLRESIIENTSYMSIIKKVTIFSKYSQGDVNKYFDCDHRYITLLSLDNINNELFHTLKIDRRNPYFTETLELSFLRLIHKQWHSYREGVHITLGNAQRVLAKSVESAHRKIKGVAGSGKTLVMAYRAVDAMIRTGKPVLILTFNITLRNYISYRIKQIPADFNWDNITILNYHEFFNSQAINSGKRVMSLDAYKNIRYFEGLKVHKYAAIFIDEVQDYQEEWLRIIHDTFLDQGGEFVVFGDKAQNVYHRTLGSDNEPVIPYVSGEWNESLDEARRYNSGDIFNLTQKFYVHFINKEQVFNLQLNLGKTRYIKYSLVSCNTSADMFGQWCLNIMKKFGLSAEKTVVLASTSDLLQNIDLYYRKYSMKKTKITFASLEQFKKIGEGSAAYFKLNDNALSRVKKLHFTMDCDCLKMSTIYSFKGWEADNVILFIQKPEPTVSKSQQGKLIYEAPADTLSPEIIYTALTRARKNLFIINLENNLYDDFFKNNLK
jgi:hypothetical protein